MKQAMIILSSLLLSAVSSTIREYREIFRTTANRELVPSGYRRGKKIGSGGFCNVFEGFHEDDANHSLALRVCQYKWTVNPRDRFIKECGLLKSARHENVLNLIDCFEIINNYYVFVVEYMKDGDLFDFIFMKRGATQCVPENVVQHVFRELLHGVEHLHNKRIIHRDLKPENILLGPGYAVKISDFGLADKLDENQSVFTGCKKCGTPGYIAPEMQTGVHTFSADVYSVGVILYEIATCRKFPEEYSKTRIIASLLNHRIRPPDLVELIVGMTEQVPSKRLTIRQVRESSYVLEVIAASS